MTNTADIADIAEPAVNLDTPLSSADLVKEALAIDDYCKQQQKALAEFLKPYRDRADWIEKVLLKRLIDNKEQSVKTEFGTFYKVTIFTPKIVDREKYLDLVLENYDTFGAGMLQLGAPQKAAFDEYMKEHEGQLPPGCEQTSFTRVNIRRS